MNDCIDDIMTFPGILREIVPSNYGETFLHPHWHEILMRISRLLPHTMIVLPTNGFLMDVDALVNIQTLKIVNISVNAEFQSTYSLFHSTDYSNYNVVVNNIVKLKKLRPDVTIWVSMAFDPQYQSPLEVECFKSHWGGIIGINNVMVNPAQYNNNPSRRPLTPVTHPCRSLFSDLVINVDGRCSSCCFDADCDDELFIGDANCERLLNIWHGVKFHRIRDLHLSGNRGKIKICERCTFA